MPKIEKHHVGVHVEKNAFVDEGDGTVSFPKGLVITDGSEQRNGTKYDIKSMDIGEYQGQVTADHFDKLDHTIAGVEGLEKVGNKVIIKKINYLIKENPLARLAYNLLLSPKVPTNFSIETFGPWPNEEDGTYYDSKLIGLSQVVVGNNRSAKVNSIVVNSIEQAREDGLDTTELEAALDEEKQFSMSADHKSEVAEANNNNNNDKETPEMTFVTIKNSRDFAVKVKFKNAAGSDVEQEVPAGSTLDVSDDQKDAVEKQLTDAQPEKPAEAPAPAPAPAPADANGDANNAFADMLAAAMKPMNDKLEAMEKNAFNNSAQEPQFKPAGGSNGLKNTKNEFAAMDWQDRHAKQINAAWDILKRHDSSQADILNKINEVNLEGLKEKGIVKNSMTIGDFGNFIISTEMLTDINGQRNDYTPLVNATNWKETLSTQMAWITRQGDISMQEVAFCETDASPNGNLKPISEYGATVDTANLHELAAVTPVCNAATRFLAVDLLGDVAAGYRNDYDRKRAQLVIARLEQAVEGNGNSVVYDTAPSVEALVTLLTAYSKIAQISPNGTFILNNTSYASILGYALRAGISGPLSQIFTTGDQPRMFGRPYLIVSDDLMPSLDTAGTVTFGVEGTNVTINHAVFYADLSKFTGRTSGGLQYDLSTEAAYEDAGVVKSAYQRNELVLRGSFFRGGAITDPTRVAGILAPGVS